MNPHSKDDSSKIIKCFINISKRKCPCCKNKVIIPFYFKKFDPYYCLSCGSHIESNVILSITLTLLMVSFSVYLGSIGLHIFSILVLIIMIIRQLFLDIFDAIILPLREHIP